VNLDSSDEDGDGKVGKDDDGRSRDDGSEPDPTGQEPFGLGDSDHSHNLFGPLEVDDEPVWMDEDIILKEGGENALEEDQPCE
jgi:hypothetical protein